MIALSARTRFAIVATLAGMVALAARGWGIWAEPMWLDEGYSAYAASKGWAFLWQIVPRYETHPPFYYSLLRAWTLIIGDGLVAHRMLGLVCGLATLPVVALAARRLARLAGAKPVPVTLAALALTAVAPMLVAMSREIRPYPLMILVYASATLALLAIAERRAAGRPLAGRAFAGYLACAALMLWLHNLGPLYAAALGLALLCVAQVQTMRRGDWLWLFGGHAIVLAIWSPALFILLDQAPMWVKATWLKWSTVDLWRRATVVFAGPRDDLRIAALVLALFGGAVLLRVRGGWRLLVALLLLSGLPLAVSLIVSATIAPVFIIRTMTPLAVPAILLMACAAHWHRWRFGWLAPAAALLWLVVGQTQMDLRARQHIKRDWYRTMEWLAPRFRPGDIVFAYPNEGALPFDRAVRDYGLAMPSRPIPTAIPSLNPPQGSWYVSGSRGVPSLDRAHLRLIAEEPATRAVPTIWLLRLGPWAYDKGDVFLEELSKGRVEVGRFKDGAIDIVGLRRADLDAAFDWTHEPTPKEQKQFRACVDELGGIAKTTITDCVPFSPPATMQGFWLIEFESSRFVETNKRELPFVYLAHQPLLELMPAAAASQPDYSGRDTAFRVKFVGRRSVQPGLPSEDMIVVDRMLSMEPVPLPIIRHKNFERRPPPPAITPAKAGASGSAGAR